MITLKVCAVFCIEILSRHFVRAITELLKNFVNLFRLPRRARKIYRKNANDLQGPFEMSRDGENSSH